MSQIYLCPKCGQPCTPAPREQTRDTYPLECVQCDENFFTIECKQKDEPR